MYSIKDFLNCEDYKINLKNDNLNQIFYNKRTSKYSLRKNTINEIIKS